MINELFNLFFVTFIIILYIVQCWTQTSKPEPLKQDKNEKNENENIYIQQKININETSNIVKVKKFINKFKLI